MRKKGPQRSGRVALFLAAAAVVAIAGGFVGFANSVAGARAPEDPKADAIVVFTGGVARIDGALQLLADRRASRVLISGVNRVVTPKILADTVPGDKRDDLACCVDLGHDARDTIGNAVETRQWAESQGFTSLIVVTSDYHMARSMVELGTAMPTMRLIAFPVKNPELHLDRWWRDPSAFGLLVREYFKLLTAKVRLAIAAPSPPGVAAAG